jgi:HK97 gp10 family phage protein
VSGFNVQFHKVFDKLPEVAPAVEAALEGAISQSLARIKNEATQTAPRSQMPPHHPESAHMADQFVTEQQGLVGEVGNTASYFVDVEEGTAHMPPRPSLGPAAALESLDFSVHAATAVVKAIPK